MRYVKLLTDQLVESRTCLAGEVVPLPDVVADRFVNGKHGVIVPDPSFAGFETATAAPAPERATLKRPTAPGKRK